MSMSNLLHRLEIQLAAQYPDILRSLNPPATLDQIAAFEAEVGQSLPEDVKAAYLWHNGSGDPRLNISFVPPDESFLLIDNGRWLALDEMLTQWHMQNNMAEGDDYAYAEDEDPQQWAKCVWRPWMMPPLTWLALGRSCSQNHVYIDFQPAPMGQSGQLIFFALQGYEHYVAPSLQAYFTMFVEALERKGLRYDLQYQQWLGLDEAYNKAGFKQSW